MIRLAGILMLAAMLTGCGAAAGAVDPQTLGVSARDAYVEARSMARVWSQDARLRWVEGEGIDASGIALANEGGWTFHYTAPGRTRGLVVRIQALESGTEERPPSSPPGIVIGDNALGTSWVDSRAVMEALATAGAESASGPASMLLVPTRPEQWIVRLGDAADRWRIHAETGEVLSP